jgi:AraC-like DNA-binding protein
MMLSRRPVAPLAAYVHSLWAIERGPRPHPREINLPTGCMDIVIPLREGQVLRRWARNGAGGEQFDGAVLHGAHDRATQRDTTEASTVVGVHFKPGGAAALFGGVLPQLRNRAASLEDLCGPAARALRDDLLETTGPHARLMRVEAWLMARLASSKPRDELAAQAVAAMLRNPAANLVEPLRGTSGLGPTRFIARFEQHVGLTPKRFARVLRFHALVRKVAAAPAVDWALAAAEAGYADQSHLIHEFRRLAGMTPTAYVPLEPGQPEHVALRLERKNLQYARQLPAYDGR